MDPRSLSAAEPLIEWAVAERALPGQAESGDDFLVLSGPDEVLVAVVDGLGHGPQAAAAARLAVATLREHGPHDSHPLVVGGTPGAPLDALLRQCHQALLRSRGVVLTLGTLDARHDTLTWLSVGNVEAVLLRVDPSQVRASVVQRGGVVGGQLPPLRPTVVALMRGDTLVLATDGIRADFLKDLKAHGAPRDIAAGILARHARPADDALVMVVRYLGRGP